MDDGAVPAGAKVGPFRLRVPVAEGGMGEVWQAEHPVTHVLVAVKVPHPDATHDPRVLEALQTEVRAAAGLRHPHVQEVLDAGLLPVDAAWFGLAPGTPWLASGWLEQSLHERPPRGFSALRRVLCEVLSALSHAHARGILHRDVKPANVLWEGRHVRLVDFGLAVSHDAHGLTSGGTPGYAAPEQMAHGVQGPWTDVYGVAALAYALLTGLAPPPRGPLPELPDAPGLPAGLREWLAVAGASHWRARFPTAAAAAAALRALRPGRTPLPVPAPRLPSVAAPTLWDVLETDAEEAAAPASRGRRVRLPRPPPPPPPRRDVGSGVGLGLIGARQAGLVGRADLRALLWQALAEARRGPRVVVLHGPMGIGKSALAEWVARAAIETGAGEGFVAVHDPEPGPGSGLAGLVARALGPGDPLAAARARLPHGEDTAVADLLGLAPREATTEQRHQALLRWIPHLCGDRRPVVWLDDVQWGPEAVALAARWVQHGPPALLVVTSTVPLPSLGPARRVRSVEVPPVPRADLERMLTDLVGLASGCVDEVLDAASGSPALALRLVELWAALGVLRPGPSGFVRAPDAPIPRSFDGVWTALVGASWSTLDAAERGAVTVAAALGREVDETEWRSVCGALGFARPDGLVGRLLAARIATPDPGRGVGCWRFAHARVTEGLLTLAAPELRLEVHRACAAHLPTGGARRAAQLEAAGDLEAAAVAWRECHRALYDRDHRGARDAARRGLECLARAPERHPALLARLAAAAAQSAEMDEDYEAMAPHVALLRSAAHEAADALYLATADYLDAGLAEGRGAWREAFGAYAAAGERFEALGTPQAMLALTRAALLAPDPEAAGHWLARARAASDDPYVEVVGVQLESRVDPDAAARRAAALEGPSASWSPLTRARLLHVHAAALLLRDPAHAAVLLRRTLALREQLGVPSPFATLDLAQALVLDDRADEALPLVVPGRDLPADGAALTRCGACIRAGRWRAAAREARRVGTLLDSDVGFARALATLATDAGHPRLAGRLRRLAAEGPFLPDA